MPKVRYTKKWKSIDDQIRLLISRGLQIKNTAAAESFLRHINYYRLTGYALPFQRLDEKGNRVFKNGTSFEDIEWMYFFDRALRDLMFEASEIIELDFRAAIAYHLGKVSAFPHLDDDIYKTDFLRVKPGRDASEKEDWIAEARKVAKRKSGRTLFIQSYANKYFDFPDLPIWILTEMCSFGAFSRLYSGLAQPHKTAIANVYGLQACDLASMIHHIVYVRNICAHHARLFDNEMSIRSSIPVGKIWSGVRNSTKTFFASLIIHKWMLDKCAVNQTLIDNWRSRMEDLIFSAVEKYPCVLKSMGLSENWSSDLIWRQPQDVRMSRRN